MIAVEPQPWRRDAAADLGIEAVAPEGLPDYLKPTGDRPRVPLAIEVSGNPDALRDRARTVGARGRSLVASWYGTKDVALPLGGEFHRRRLTIRSTQVSTIPARLSDRWNADDGGDAVVDLLDDLPLDRSRHAHRSRSTDAGDAYAAIDAGRDGLIHVALGYR